MSVGSKETRVASRRILTEKTIVKYPFFDANVIGRQLGHLQLCSPSSIYHLLHSLTALSQSGDLEVFYVLNPTHYTLSRQEAKSARSLNMRIVFNISKPEPNKPNSFTLYFND